MKKIILSILVIALLLLSNNTTAQEKKSKTLKDISLSGLSFRSIGPRITGGRVVAIAVNPNNNYEYYIVAGSGSLWKTVNNGITFSPIFENEKTNAIGAVVIDPNNTNVLWVGTGENKNHNNVGYGDGIYKSEDGGKVGKYGHQQLRTYWWNCN